ncbi:MAG: sensor histidine kinase [Saprospiraceae bacterium]|nr:sensor histidine kinase [Saprospiraceae bacterium]
MMPNPCSKGTDGFLGNIIGFVLTNFSFGMTRSPIRTLLNRFYLEFKYFCAMFQFDQTYTHWSWERLSRHILYWMAWLSFYVIINSNHQDVGLLNWTLLELTVMCVKLPVTYFTIYYLVQVYLLPKKYLAFIISFFSLAFIGGVIISMMYSHIFNPYIFGLDKYNYWNVKISYKVVDLIYIACVPIVIKMYQRQAQAEKKAAQLIQQKLGAELKVLKNQMHPHFLFNTLNNLYSMVLTQDDKAADVVVRLSNMMSYMLYECEQPLIDLEKEINNLRNYIELEKIRYGNRLDISFETGGDINGKTIPPLLLLPFLENAFKHGVEKTELSSWVRVNLWVSGNELTYMVENSVPSSDLENTVPDVQSGIGLSNIRKRLELLYLDHHELEIRNDETFLAKLKLNFNHEVSHS